MIEFSYPPASAPEAEADFGAKAARLISIPPAWRPVFLLVSVATYKDWQRDRASFLGQDLAELHDRLARVQAVLGDKWLVRSSATDETAEDRGQHLSLAYEAAQGALRFLEILDEVFAAYATSGAGSMAIIVHRYVESEERGFLSNDLRVSPKPYRWVFQSEIESASPPSLQVQPLSAKQAKPFDVADPLIAMSHSELLSRARAVAHYFWRSEQNRCVIEWCWDGTRLWLVQCDSYEKDTEGLDPRNLVTDDVPVPSLETGRLFQRFRVGSKSPWSKLSKVAQFTTKDHPPPHRLFWITAENLDNALATSTGPRLLAEEIGLLTAGRAVIRTDDLGGGFNLPRTPTVNPEEAVDWLRLQVEGHKRSGKKLSDIIFILHAFIHAQAAAWSFFSLTERVVRVDGLWGLADGMQYHPTDTYYFDLSAQKEVSPTIRFKSHALLEQPDGQWTIEEVAPAFGRYRALTKREVSDIARQTAEIAANAGTNVQIMWFVGVPQQLGLGENLPWFMVTPDELLEEPRAQSMRTVRVREQADLVGLDELQPGSAKILLEPLVEEVRSDSFVSAVAAKSKQLNLPVEIRGSILSHAFHQLRKAGIDVCIAEPGNKPSASHRKTFNKVVRDDIPKFITEKGEAVVFAKLDERDVLVALLGKLIEEAQELAKAKKTRDKSEELADIYELIRGISASMGVSLGDVVGIANSKREKRGGFERGVILRETSIEAGPSDQELFTPQHQSSPLIRPLADFLRISTAGPSAKVPMSRLLAQEKPIEVHLSATGQKVTLTLELVAGVLGVRVERVEDGPQFQPGLFDREPDQPE